MGENFRQTQMPSVVFRAIVLEQESAAYTLSVHPTEAAAVARLEAERRKFNPRCADPCWMWVETVQGGEVIARRDVSTNPTEMGPFATA